MLPTYLIGLPDLYKSSVDDKKREIHFYFQEQDRYIKALGRIKLNSRFIQEQYASHRIYTPQGLGN